MHITSAGICGLALKTASVSNPIARPRDSLDFGAFEADGNTNLIGAYGNWAFNSMKKTLPTHSFRRKEWADIEPWRKAAKEKVLERITMSDIGKIPKVTIHKEYHFDGLQVEEISWGLPYGRPTEAIVLKPANAKAIGPLPDILAFNNPPVADFNDPRLVKVVELDEACRKQQLGEGWFPSLSDVPMETIILMISAIMSCKIISCVVPDKFDFFSIRYIKNSYNYEL